MMNENDRKKTPTKRATRSNNQQQPKLTAKLGGDADKPVDAKLGGAIESSKVLGSSKHESGRHSAEKQSEDEPALNYDQVAWKSAELGKV